MEKNTLSFLAQLAENNNKGWMDANRDWYLQEKSNFLETVDQLLKGLTKIEPRLDGLKPQNCVFRLNRDIRFSPNKDPYKIHLAAYFAIGGKNSEGPGYYLHIQPHSSFVGGGVYFPAAESLKKIRQEIDYSGNELASILDQKDFKDRFGEIQGETLKTSPRNYNNDHPHIRYLRMKSFMVSTPLSDQEILSGRYIEKTLEAFSKMKPFNDFLTRALEESESGEGLIS
jgi:uncharacterized protein (TIGR02453 family)